MSYTDSKKDGKKWKSEPKKPEPILDRTPPCDVSAEMAVLGSILLMPDVCDDLVMSSKRMTFTTTPIVNSTNT